MYLYGASGHAKVIMDSLLSQGISIEGCIDDNPDLTELMGYSIVHHWQGQSPIIVSIGINRTRHLVVQRLIETAKQSHLAVEFGQGIHTSAIISPAAVIGEGTVVMQGAIVQTCCQIGCHCIVNTGAS